MNFQLKEDDLRYNLFLMERGLNGLASEEESSQSTWPAISDPMTWGRAGSEAGYRCAKCRTVLFYTAHVVPHSRERPAVWWDEETELERPDYRPSCGRGLFVILLPWMEGGKGRLHCGKCEAKLGSVSLEGGGQEGLSCPCGARAVRGVWVNSKKVDKFALPRYNPDEK